MTDVSSRHSVTAYKSFTGLSEGIAMLRPNRTVLLALALIVYHFMITASYAEINFIRPSGFYDESFLLILRSDLDQGDIRYTTDGSVPTRNRGKLFGEPIIIATTTVVRAFDFTENADGKIATRSFVFPSHVRNQPAFPEGYIRSIESRRKGPSRPHEFDWEMDDDVVNNTADNGRLVDSLLSIPTLSIVMDVDDFNFIYENHQSRGIEVERPASIELFYPERVEYQSFKGFQIDCGIRMQGGGAVDQARKKSFRLLFKAIYGAGKLRYPLFESAIHHASTATDQFDTVVLRAGGNTNWSKDDAWKHEPSTYLRDTLVRDSQIAASGFGSRSLFAHLYINGLYFGLYNAAERPDSKFMQAYFGGDEEDYYSINHGGTVDGDSSRWNQILASSNLQNLEEVTSYRRVRDQVAIEDFCDYVLLNWLVGMGDWPWNNFYGGMRVTSSGKIRFFSWDSEYAHWTIPGYLNSNPTAWVNPRFETDSRQISTLWRALEKNPDFRMVFADRVYRQCFENGSLTDDDMRMRFQRLVDSIQPAIVAESARWGDSAWGRENDPHTRKADFFPNVQKILELMEGNAALFVQRLRQAGLYPSIDPPKFLKPIDPVAVGFHVVFQNPNQGGVLYYTVDGTDPRIPELSEVSSTAESAENGQTFQITGTTRVRARVLSKGIWSALSEHLYLVEDFGIPLRISELMFNPVDGEALEFVEVLNISQITFDLTGLRFSGIDYRFSPGTQIKPFQALVLIPNDAPELFSSMYPKVSVFGLYRGHLSNAGEEIKIIDAADKTVFSTFYEDGNGVSPSADGTGYSLNAVNIRSMNSDATNWRTSKIKGGTPGVHSGLDSDQDGLTDFDELISGTDPFDSRSGLRIEIKRVAQNRIRLSFDAIPGREYLVEVVDEVRGMEWVSVTTSQASPGLIEESIDDVNTSRLYRISVTKAELND